MFPSPVNREINDTPPTPKILPNDMNKTKTGVAMVMAATI